MRKYLLASAAGAAVVIASHGAFAQSLNKQWQPGSSTAMWQGKSAPPGTTQAPSAIPLVNTGDFWFGVYGRADMYGVIDGTTGASVAARVPSGTVYYTAAASKGSKTVTTAYVTSSNDAAPSRLGFNSDQIFAPGWDAYEVLEMRLNYATGAVGGLTNASGSALGTTDGALSTGNGSINGSGGGDLFGAGGGFAYIMVTGQNFGQLKMGRDTSYTTQPNTVENLDGQDSATTILGYGSSRTNDTLTYNTMPSFLGGHVVLGVGLQGLVGGNVTNGGTAPSAWNYTSPDANSSFFDSSMPEWGANFVSPDRAWNVYYGGMVYLNRQPNGGYAESNGLTLGLGGTSYMSGSATNSIYGLTDTNNVTTSASTGSTGTFVGAGKNQWWNALGFKYDGGFFNFYGQLSDETGAMIANPASGSSAATGSAYGSALTGSEFSQTSDYWTWDMMASLLFNAPQSSYALGGAQNVAGASQLVGTFAVGREFTKVDVVSSTNNAILKANVNPTAYKLGVHYGYFFTPSLQFTTGVGYIWNQNGAAAANGGAANGVMQDGNSWALNSGLDFLF